MRRDYDSPGHAIPAPPVDPVEDKVAEFAEFLRAKAAKRAGGGVSPIGKLLGRSDEDLDADFARVIEGGVDYDQIAPGLKTLRDRIPSPVPKPAPSPIREDLPSYEETMAAKGTGPGFEEFSAAIKRNAARRAASVSPKETITFDESEVAPIIGRLPPQAGLSDLPTIGPDNFRQIAAQALKNRDSIFAGQDRPIFNKLLPSVQMPAPTLYSPKEGLPSYEETMAAKGTGPGFEEFSAAIKRKKQSPSKPDIRKAAQKRAAAKSPKRGGKS